MPLRIQQKEAQDQLRPGRLGQGNVGITVSVNSLHTITEWANFIAEIPPTGSFLKSTLFGDVENYWGEQIAIDYFRGSSRCAPFCSPYKRGLAIPRKRFQTSWVEFPNIKVTRDIRALDLRYRSPGRSPSDQDSAAQRMSDLQILDYLDLDGMISRTEEYMCSRVLTDGKLDVIDGDDQLPIMQVDFGPINQVVIPASEWWDVNTSDPIAHLELIRRHVTASGFPTNFYVFGADAASAFLRNTQVRESSNFLNFRRGEIDVRTFQAFEDWGVNVIGNFQGMNIVSYEAMYEDSLDNKQHFYFPPDMILLASTASQNRFGFGRVTQVEENNTVVDYNLPRVPQYVSDPKTDELLFRLWARPLPVPRNTSTWAVAKVCNLVSQPIEVPSLVDRMGRH